MDAAASLVRRGRPWRDGPAGCRIAVEYAPDPRRTGANESGAAESGRGVPPRTTTSGRGRGPLPPGAPLRGGDVPHQPGRTGRSTGPSRTAQATPLVGSG